MDPAPPPLTFVVVGATGDLFQRKLLPALFQLAQNGKLPDGSLILGVARKPIDEPTFQSTAVAALNAAGATPAAAVASFCQRALRYQRLDGETAADFGRLRTRIEEEERSRGLAGHRIFYLALPLEAFGPTIQGLGDAGLHTSPGFTRVVIEKPFGRDLASAQALNACIYAHFDESQIYRIDHYLGKETVQNLLVFRFANLFVESLWNRSRVEHVEITAAESIGLEGRANYYDEAGALRDIVQNHVTQLLTLVAMEPPATLDADAIRNEKVKVLRSTVRLTPADVVRGQYGPGTVDGAAVPGYREEAGITPTSDTETFVALRLKIANWRWQDVPFFIRAGKRLPTKSTRIVVTFRAPPVAFFQSAQDYGMNPDRVTILLQPEEGFELAFEVKVPGREIRVQTHRMKFHYADVFGPLPDGYETLLYDVMIGDATLFVRADEVEESWRLYGPILSSPPRSVPYAAGSEGPAEAERLVAEWGKRWIPP